jgi:predicted Fe-Mo cluster-binding NifX family protein
MTPRVIALGCRLLGSDLRVSSLEACSTLVLVTWPDRRIDRIVSIASRGCSSSLDKATQVRAQRPDLVIVSEIDPYSLVALSAKGTEVRLVMDDARVEEALDLYSSGEAKLACNAIGPTGAQVARRSWA